MQVKALDSGNDLSISEDIFNRDFNSALVHQVLVAFQAKARSGTKAQKNRSDVRGGGRKPWNQKGGGRARAGTSSSPIWRSGGVTFAARNRDFSQKVNRKMYKGAIKCILSKLVQDGRLRIVGNLEFEKPSTKKFVELMKSWDMTNAMFILHNWDENFCLSARNYPGTDFCDVNGLHITGLMKMKNVIIEESALKHLEEVLS